MKKVITQAQKTKGNFFAQINKKLSFFSAKINIGKTKGAKHCFTFSKTRFYQKKLLKSFLQK